MSSAMSNLVCRVQKNSGIVMETECEVEFSLDSGAGENVVTPGCG